MRGLCCVVLMVLAGPLLPGAALARPSLSAAAEVEAGGGYDDNVFLSGTPDPRTGSLRLGGGFAQISPRLVGGLTSGGLRLELTYAGDLRWADNVGRLSFQELALSAALPSLGRLRLQVGAVAGRFDAQDFVDDGFHLAGGEAGLRVEITDRVRLAAVYRAEIRAPLPGSSSRDPAVDDLFQQAHGRVSVQLLPRWDLAASIAYLRLAPTQPGATGTFQRGRVGLDTALIFGPLSTFAGAWVGPVRVSGRADRTYAGARAEARVPLWSALGLYAAVDWATPVTSGADDDYARRLATLGVVLHATTPPPPLSLMHTPELDLRPLVQRDRVRFRFKAPVNRAPGTVELVGSWDDWITPGRKLASTETPGLFELWATLPPGSHRYHFLVDGEAVRPPAAPRYAPDGFGGQDGVLEIGAEHSGNAN